MVNFLVAYVSWQEGSWVGFVGWGAVTGVGLPMAGRRSRLLALATAVLCAWRQPGTHAYDPFQTDTSAPWNKNASKRFHPVCVCARGARRAARPARARAAYVRA